MRHFSTLYALAPLILILQFTETQTRGSDNERERVHGNRRPCGISRLSCGVPEEDVQASQRARARRHENPRYGQPHTRGLALNQLAHTKNILESALVDTSSFTRLRTVDTLCDFIREGVWQPTRQRRTALLICDTSFQLCPLSKSDWLSVQRRKGLRQPSSSRVLRFEQQTSLVYSGI